MQNTTVPSRCNRSINNFASRDEKGEAVDAKEVYIILHEMKKCEVYRRIKF